MSLQLTLLELTEQFRVEETQIALGGGEAAIERQHKKGRMTARERIEKLLDPNAPRLELGQWAGWEMYQEWGGAAAAGVVCVIGQVAGKRHLIIANDATVKAGAFFPATAKKVLRAQKIAFANRLPLIYLVDSAGIFLPLQEDTFPDEDDFGRIFRNNAVMSAAGLSQTAAIMGNCVAGGGYLPVLCDKLLMTEGSGLYLAGPALVKSAIGQQVSSEELGGAEMHAEISGTIDYREESDTTCIERLRRLAENITPPPKTNYPRAASQKPARPGTDLYDLVSPNPQQEYEVREVLDCILDANTFDEFKADYGGTLVCGTAKLGGFSIGIVATQHHQIRPNNGPIQFGGVLYVDSAEKGARFVMNCNQDGIPILFLQDVNGFMVGKDSERSGIIKAGAKLVSAISNSRVPKLTVLVGGSYGAGNYALCGKAFDPRFIFAWPNSRCSVMGGSTATSTLLDIMVRGMKRDGETVDADALEKLRKEVEQNYARQMDPRYAAARGWTDAIIDPAKTREVLIESLEVVTNVPPAEDFKLGVFQV